MHGNSNILDGLKSGIISSLCDLSVRKSNILYEDNSATKTETLNENVKNSSVADNKSVSEINISNDSGSTKN